MTYQEMLSECDKIKKRIEVWSIKHGETGPSYYRAVNFINELLELSYTDDKIREEFSNWILLPSTIRLRKLLKSVGYAYESILDENAMQLLDTTSLKFNPK